MAIPRRSVPESPMSWPLRPALDLLLFVSGAALAGMFLLAIHPPGGLPSVDEAARSIVALHVNSGLNQFMIGITSIGGEMVLFVAFCALALWCSRSRGARWARFAATIGVGALALDNVVKPLVGRPRPMYDQLVEGSGASFPSGHTTGTTALLCALAFCLCYGKTSAQRRTIWAAALSAAILMGASRVYVGVHWPTDVIAGILLGAGWTIMCARSQGISKTAATKPPKPAWSPRRLIPVVVALAVIGSACDSTSNADRSGTGNESSPASSTQSLAGPDYDVDIDSANFVDRIDNPYFPLEPGTVFRLRGETEDGIENETITVTGRTKEILGVETTVVKDVMRVDGEVAEFTFDWYAQDIEGNVWYFGENTAEIENGEVANRHGSWEAGVDGAQPGIIMNTDPQVTDSYRQEFFAGEAEDMYWVVATGESKTTPLGKFDDVVRTLEWNPLEPGVVVEKFYAPDLGLLSERALSGGKENVELIEVIRP